MKMKELFALLIVAAMMVTILPLGVFAAADGLEIFYHDFEENTDGWTAHGGSNASDGVFHIKDYTWPEFKFPVLQMGAVYRLSYRVKAEDKKQSPAVSNILKFCDSSSWGNILLGCYQPGVGFGFDMSSGMNASNAYTADDAKALGRWYTMEIEFYEDTATAYRNYTLKDDTGRVLTTVETDKRTLAISNANVALYNQNAGVIIDVDDILLERVYKAPVLNESAITITSMGQVQSVFSDVDPAVDSIVINFGTEMDPATVTADSVCLKDATGNKVPALISKTEKTATLTPNACLEAGVDYTLFFAKTVANVLGLTVGESDVTFPIHTNQGRISAAVGTPADEGTNLNIPITYTNSTKADVNPGIIVAYLGANNKLLGIDVANGNPMTKYTKNGTLTYSHLKQTHADVVATQVMVWDSLNTRRPATGNEFFTVSNEGETTFTYKDGNIAGTLVLEGSGALAGDTYSVLVLKGANAPGTNLAPGVGVYDAATGTGEVAFVGEMVASSNKTFTTTFMLPASGTYSMYLVSKNNKNEVWNQQVEYVDATEYQGVANQLNAQANLLKDADETNDEAARSAFKQLVKDNLFILGFDKNLLPNVSVDAAADIFCNQTIETPVEQSDKIANVTAWKTCQLISLLNGKAIDDATVYLNEIAATNSLASYYNKYLTDAPAKQFMTEIMSGNNLADIAALEQAVSEAIVLTVVKYPDGYMNMKTLLQDAAGITGISVVTDLNGVYQRLAGVTFANIQALVDRYCALVAEESNPQPQHGGFSGGGGGGVSYNNKTEDDRPVTITPTVQTEKAEPVTMKFTDLDTVMWAYEAISFLSDKGIINGVSETSFDPEEAVKREEFVKMVLLALGLDGSAINKFTDVDSNAWYANFVAYANALGIVNGRGDHTFGVGESIQRQDMAVILCNALKKKNINKTGEAVSFDDIGEVAPYALDAVNLLSSLKVINGDGTGNFNPGATATRAEAAQMIFGMLKILG